MKQIVLEKDWGRYKAKVTLDVLGPGEEIRPKAVDPLRAETLVKTGFASEVKEAPAAADKKTEKPAPAKASARKG